ncbi:uncharacterized protein LOC109846165 [Asparagus officinalis]|uniref:uncharacterized protein LOC109846165 n=1 Tax=Asparagus officinalis TaxID=4686 RepID=UPI00098E3452|nr:uncharacterized protein LOC109846165 [Asparagus officinalis]
MSITCTRHFMVYVKLHGHGNCTILVLLYVDDLIITGTHDHLLSRLIRRLSSEFDMKDLGALNLFLGMQVVRNHDSLILSQTQYALTLLHRFGLSGVKPIKSPLEVGLQLSSLAPDPLPDHTIYRQMVGSLQYLTMTRLDLTYAVNHVCQFMQKPCSSHLAAVKRIFRYVKGTLSLGLRFSKDDSLQIRAFSDVDWAGCPDSQRSTTGYVVFLGQNLLSWGSKKQSTISRSSAEAEYRALASTTTEVLWFLHMLRFLRVDLSNPPLLLYDNISAIHMSKNSVFHSRTKNIGIDVHFIRAHVL